MNRDSLAEATDRLVETLGGAPAGTLARAREIREHLETEDLLPALRSAVAESVKLHRDSTVSGMTREQIIGMHVAVGESQSPTQTAMLSAVTLEVLSSLVTGLERLISHHSENIGFAAPELVAEKQRALISSISARLSAVTAVDDE